MDSRIRILFLIFSFDIEAVGGGISRFVVSLSQALDPAIFDVSICGLWDRGTAVETERVKSLNQAGVRAFTCSRWNEAHPYQSFINSYRKLRQWIKEQPVDIIHSHSLFGDIAALWLHVEGKAPVIIRTLHNELRTEWNRRPIRRLLLTNFLYPATFTTEIGVSQSITDDLNQRWLAKRSNRRAVMIHNALDIERFSGTARDHISARGELGIQEGAFLVGSVGRLTRQKGYDLLLEAGAMVIDKIPGFRLVIIGDGEDAGLLNQMAEKLELNQIVLFTGSRNDVECLLPGIDLFVCSSRWEGFSTVLMEAMAAGVPIVATNIPGNRELLQPGKTAWFVDPENAQSLSEGLIKAFQNQELSKEFASNARKVVRSFTIDEVAQKHERMYRFIFIHRDESSWLQHKTFDTQIEKQVENT